jgi:hypothetical protein
MEGAPPAGAGDSRFTVRLRLEPVGPANATDLWLVHNDDEVWCWYGSEKPSLEQAQQWARFMSDSWRLHGVHKWIAHDRISGDIVGRGGLSRTPVDDDWGQIYAFLPAEPWVGATSRVLGPRLRVGDWPSWAGVCIRCPTSPLESLAGRGRSRTPTTRTVIGVVFAAIAFAITYGTVKSFEPRCQAAALIALVLLGGVLLLRRDRRGDGARHAPNEDRLGVTAGVPTGAAYPRIAASPAANGPRHDPAPIKGRALAQAGVRTWADVVERVKGIEPSLSDWEFAADLIRAGHAEGTICGDDLCCDG